MHRPITDILHELRRGDLVDEASDALKEVVTAVEQTGKAGELTLKLIVKPASKGTGTMVIADKLTKKMPELPRGETIMFSTPEGNLQTSDPRQKIMEFKVAAAAAPSAIKQV
ncbi:hypothetical protein LH433_02385 [Laribacter hongkongensis]|uniref:hypothetical protein n=1 Tax=Laribacter hongkongensis TaxID=168471 RepID=UPI001EFED63A|nr:hypothetical protein [Laribacter hongkongensis]MCG9105604.1 hypothetical protein [Laribacter hongkongensis]